ncbi:hypothetical protein [Streptomyces sp. TP-A0356]|uniref:hypothetical protein n=1 Tax=Streptomyces sp. TP-A0356 TaxID=1359208 RepID=UPI0007C700D2|nr:hypothetical protein [Streptomyces sp. TP-A0356]
MSPAPQPSAARRAESPGELAQGGDRFHEPRREDCPWCGSTRLRTRLRTPDLVQHKPGTFVVDECHDCAHAFQNPRLTAEGLAFYHHDFHEGQPALDGFAERLLAARGSARRHRSAARAMLPTDCAFGALLGKWWMSYGQPRHLHLMPLRNLLAELEVLGCAVVTTDRREPHTPYDIAGALALGLARVLPAPDVPWRAVPPTVFRRRLRTALVGAATPLVATATALDHALAPLLRRTRFSNAYRIIARRTPSRA